MMSLVTGAESGPSCAAEKAFAGSGAAVVSSTGTKPWSSLDAKELVAHGDRPRAIRCDVATLQAASKSSRWLLETAATHGLLDAACKTSWPKRPRTPTMTAKRHVHQLVAP